MSYPPGGEPALAAPSHRAGQATREGAVHTPSGSRDSYFSAGSGGSNSPTDDRYASLPLTEEAFIPPNSARLPAEHDPMLPTSPTSPHYGSSTRPVSENSFPPSPSPGLYSTYSHGGSTGNLSYDSDNFAANRGSTAGIMPTPQRTSSGLREYWDPEVEETHREKDVERGAAGVAGGQGLLNGKWARARAMGSANPNGGGAKGFWGRMSTRGKRFVLGGAVVAVVVIVIAAAVPASLVGKGGKTNLAAGNMGSSSSSSSEGKGSSTGSSTGSSAKASGTAAANPQSLATGGDGSTVYTEDGSSFIYNNSFGGFWNAVPFSDAAQAQSYVPPLNQSWNYVTDRIYGVNLGGWLLLEPFITPSIFEPYNSATNDPTATNNAVDEWTLMGQLGTNATNVITEHYATFITEKDFAEIAGAGLNWVRIPLPYWAIEVYEGEPFLAHVGWTYFLKAIEWARKYGLRINLDLHAVPGSQNGYNHSSKLGTINFLNGVMGVANAQRTLNYIRTLAEFCSQPEYVNVIPMFSILNEPYGPTIGDEPLRHFYLEVYNMVRGITGIGEGKGPFITFHDAFFDQATSVASGGWDGFLAGGDRMAIDSHPYLCFSAPNHDSLGYQAAKPCSYWADAFNTTRLNFGVSVGGEWSLAINDCGKWINNVGNGQRFDGTYYALPDTTAPEYAAVGSCDTWDQWWNYTETTKTGLQTLAYAHMDALRDFFFWTWKTGYSNTVGNIANPLWNYQLALQNGFMPTDPRQALGVCPGLVTSAAVTMSSVPAPTLSAWMTGGSGAGTILTSAQLTSWSAWPPTALGTTPVSNLPTYTPTATPVTMAVSSPTSFPSGAATSVNVGNGWEDASDTAGWYTPVVGCTYPNPWSGVEATIPAAACTGSGSREKVRAARSPTVTPPPTHRR